MNPLEHELLRTARIARHRSEAHAHAALRGYSYRRPVVVKGVQRTPIEPIDVGARTGNALRPITLDQMVGQRALKPLLRRIIGVARTTGEPMDHMLMVGASGTGKTTTAQIVAHELGVRVFQVKAPVALDTFEQLRETMHDGEVLIIDEIHQQVSGDRRGVSQSCDPETFFHVMEDRRLATSHGMEPFPAITVIGATTDAGLLPEPFLNRFPLQPRLEPYTDADMAQIVAANASALQLELRDGVAALLASATRGTPRIANNYIRNAKVLAAGAVVNTEIAREVILVLNSTTLDGLTLDMQRMLTFLLKSKRETKAGEVSYKASVNTIATALGKSRDTKVIALFVEPYLIERGYVQVTPGGRQLTDAGIRRAKELS
jgi:holliday junction DNA helicase RuvB